MLQFQEIAHKYDALWEDTIFLSSQSTIVYHIVDKRAQETVQSQVSGVHNACNLSCKLNCCLCTMAHYCTRKVKAESESM